MHHIAVNGNTSNRREAVGLLSTNRACTCEVINIGHVLLLPGKLGSTGPDRLRQRANMHDIWRTRTARERRGAIDVTSSQLFLIGGQDVASRGIRAERAGRADIKTSECGELDRQSNDDASK